MYGKGSKKACKLLLKSCLSDLRSSFYKMANIVDSERTAPLSVAASGQSLNLFQYRKNVNTLIVVSLKK